MFRPKPGMLTGDRCVITWVEHARRHWWELADLLILAPQPSPENTRAASADVLRRFPGCLATVTPTGVQLLAHARTGEVLPFPSGSPDHCAEITYGWVLSLPVADRES